MAKQSVQTLIADAAANGSTELDLSNAGLTELPGELFQLGSLESLNLADNRLQALPAELGQLVNLRRLILDRNELTRLPAELGQLVNLQVLTVDNNKLTTLPDEIGGLGQLEELSLSNNRIQAIPAQIGRLANLQTWVDQAILYSHLEPSKPNGSGMRDQYRYLGIRTASALVEVYEALTDEERKKFARQIMGRSDAEAMDPVKTLIGSIRTNPNLALIQKWRGLTNGPCLPSAASELAAQPV